MIGIVVVAHGDFAYSLLRTAETIVGAQRALAGISFESTEGLEDLKKKMELAIKRVDLGKGILVLTDMLGGTTSIACLSFIHGKKDKCIKVISGVNLPMILEAILHRNEYNLDKLSNLLITKSKKSILIANCLSENDKKGCI